MNISVTKLLKTEQETQELAAKIANFAVCGDIIKLNGTLGTGKSTFARSFIQTLAGSEITVPSPTFTIVQTYDKTRLPVAHVDAYRLESAADLETLDLYDYFDHGVTLIEWPENIEGALPKPPVPEKLIMETEIADILNIHLEESANDTRKVTITASGSWKLRLGVIAPETSRPQNEEGRLKFLTENCGYKNPTVTNLTGDCSFRTYYKVEEDGNKAIRVLMDAPAPMENVELFANMAKHFNFCNVHTPAIINIDTKNGYILLEYFGSKPFSKGFANKENMLPWLERTVDMLIHTAKQPAVKTWSYNKSHMLKEAFRYTDWYLPYITGHATSLADRATYQNIWNRLYDKIAKVPFTLSHWDFHIYNLMMLTDEVGEGFENIGVIDFQDAKLAPVTMDMACLLNDRCPITNDEKQALISRMVNELNINEGDFIVSFRLLTLQRMLKIVGMLLRLKLRDNRGEAVMARMGETWQIIDELLEHPECNELKQFINSHSPKQSRI